MIRKLDVPIYDTNVLFLLEATEEEWAKFCSKKTNKEKLHEEEIKEANGVSYSTHELFHLADSILKDRGVEYTENNEALAYMVGWINEQYSYMLKEFNKEKGEEK